MSKKWQKWLWKDDSELSDERTGRDFDSSYWDRKPKSQSDKVYGSYDSYDYYRGYKAYKPTQVSYSYVSQITNMIATKHRVNTKVGKTWSLDLETKTLTYDPMSLMTMTKGEVMATILHEVGKIAMSLPMKSLSSPFLQEYGDLAYNVISVFDDFRIDDKMITAYPGAEAVYESQASTFRNVIDRYQRNSIRMSGWISSTIEVSADEIEKLMQSGDSFDKAYKTVMGTPPPKGKTESEILSWMKSCRGKPVDNVWDYMAIVTERGYGLSDVKGYSYTEKMEELYAKTQPSVVATVKCATMQDVTNELDTNVFPHIEELLKLPNEGSEEMSQMLGAEGARKIMEKVLTELLDGDICSSDYGREVLKGDNKEMGRSAALDSSSMPQEWRSGDYKSLLESVQAEIKELHRRLITIRRTENTVRFEPNQKRGRLDMKKLYRFKTGSTRLFKRKIETTDTLNSFTFSLLIDKSGSMGGEKIIHTTRALIMLSEVFNKLGMKFEINYFGDHVSHCKSFSDEYGKDAQDMISGIVTSCDENTNMTIGLSAITLDQRTETNRVAIILTDGELNKDDSRQCNSGYFTESEKKGIANIVLGLETTDSIKSLNNGKGIKVDNATELPKIFYEALKSLIIKR